MFLQKDSESVVIFSNIIYRRHIINRKQSHRVLIVEIMLLKNFSMKDMRETSSSIEIDQEDYLIYHSLYR